MNFTASSPRVGPRDGQLPSKRRIETVVGHQHNVPQLLAGVLDRLVDQRDLLAKPEAKPVRTDDAQQGAEADLAALEDDGLHPCR